MAQVGRPTDMTPETVKKLEEVFAIGGSDEEACFYADISKQTLYNYQKKYPEFIDRKEALKNKPFLKARQTIIKSLDQPNYAFEYMKRKKKNEFGDSVNVEGGLNVNLVSYGNDDTLELVARKTSPANSTKPGAVQNDSDAPESP
jgi:hypothetical protein